MKLLMARMLQLLLLVGSLSSCGDQPLNNPYPDADTNAAIYYTSFDERPKTLDPAKSYSSNEYLFIAQIYEPPLQYHYLLRPYQLIPATLQQMPKITYLNSQQQEVAETASDVAYTVYTLTLRPGIRYQPHPAFARDIRGARLYHTVTESFLAEKNINTLADFPETSTRECVAADYIYQIKRLANPDLQSPISGLMSDYIVGLRDYVVKMQRYRAAHPKEYIDLRLFDFEGVKQISRYEWQIKVIGKYPQFIYWLAMPFFAPMPWEADFFFQQPGMAERNITLDWYGVGTGPFMLQENNPNRQMVLVKNPNFHGETYPSEGMPQDVVRGLLDRKGQALPLIDKAVFALEKEAVPRWNKFLQGYYDASGVSSDSFDQAIAIDPQGIPELTPELHDKKIRLQTSVSASVFYFGFNMQDEVVGGTSERARKLRQAIAIALDQEEYIAIFLNGRGLPAHSVLPPGIFGYRDGELGINTSVYQWHNGRAVRRSLTYAKQLLLEAGYPNGYDAVTHKPLLINYDVPTGAGPDDKAQLDWMNKKFRQLGVQLQIRATQYNRFQEKIRIGDTQLFAWGWHADYPDPENFLFLLYGPNGKVKFNGENAANYANPEYDKLFEAMKNMPNGPERQAVIDKMIQMLQRDTPWVPRFHATLFTLVQPWVGQTKPNDLAQNTLKYVALDPVLRHKKQLEWNNPIIWPLFVFLSLLIVSCVPVYLRYRRHERQAGGLR